jgi:hypothetical protein
MAMVRATDSAVIARLDRATQYVVTPVITPWRLQALPSSSGSTGRSSIPRRSLSNEGACDYWIPAFAGMTGGGGDDNPRCPDV